MARIACLLLDSQFPAAARRIGCNAEPGWPVSFQGVVSLTSLHCCRWWRAALYSWVGLPAFKFWGLLAFPPALLYCCRWAALYSRAVLAALWLVYRVLRPLPRPR